MSKQLKSSASTGPVVPHRRRAAIRAVRTTLAATGAVCAFAPAAHAQGSVTLYGLIDAGVGYVNNASNAHQYLMTTSVMQANRMGFKGSEDLGGGTRAIFTLENGFSVTNGAFGQGGAEFGRQAFVGLTDNKLGTLTMGNQYDFMGATLGMYESSTWLLGQFSDHPFANDRANAQRLQNSVEYLTPVMSGFQFGAMYGFSNLAGDINGAGRSYSYSASYHLGGWNVAAAYTEVAGTTLDISSLTGAKTGSVVVGGSYLRTMGVATSYQFSKTFLYAMYTQSLYAGQRGPTDVPNAQFRNYQVGSTYRLTPAWTIGTGYTLTTLGAIKLHQVNTSLDYALSKRTDVYTIVQGQHAQGNNAHAVMIGVGASSSANQLVIDIGMRHKF